MRKTLLVVAAAVALQSAAHAAEPIKLGVVNIDSGPFVASATFVRDGATFAVEQLNAQGGALGRKYELVIQNHQGTPATAIAAATKMVEQMGVSFFTGLNASSHALAISSKMPGLNALFLDATASSDDLTGKACNRNYFRVGVTDGMHIQNFRELASRSGVKSWDLMMADYAAGHDTATQFTAAMKQGGATIGKTLFAPMSSSDWGSYVSQLLEKPSDGLLAFIPSNAGIGFVKQAQPYKLFDKYKMVLSASMVNEILVPAHGDGSVGVWSAQSYFWSMPGERNAAFVKAFEARFNRKPTYIDVDAYTAFELIHHAIVKAKSTDVAAVRKALEGMKLSAIAGDVEMRAADHQLLRPMVVLQAAKAGDGKGEMAMRSLQPAAKVTPPVSPECKM